MSPPPGCLLTCSEGVPANSGHCFQVRTCRVVHDAVSRAHHTCERGRVEISGRLFRDTAGLELGSLLAGQSLLLALAESQGRALSPQAEGGSPDLTQALCHQQCGRHHTSSAPIKGHTFQGAGTSA